jgi:hypothetical protein
MYATGALVIQERNMEAKLLPWFVETLKHRCIKMADRKRDWRMVEVKYGEMKVTPNRYFREEGISRMKKL